MDFPAAVRTPALLIAGFVLVSLAKKVVESRRQEFELPLPPGPRSLPLIGNLLDINIKEPWLTFDEWAAKYGNIIHCKLFSLDIVVLQTEEAVRELLENRSWKYSDRVEMATFEPYGMAFITSMIGYTDTWRFHRRLYHQVFRSEVAQTFRPMQLRKVHQLARNLMSAPEDFYEHLHTLGTAVAMAAVYDYDIEPRHDPLVKVVDNAISNMIGAPEQGALVGAFPFLKYIPPWLPGGRYNASVSKKYANILVSTPFHALKERMERGEAIHGLGTISLRRFQEEDETGELVETIRNACATAFAAGSDTTTATLVIFVYAMMNNPEIQAKAQAELDSVVGRERLPTYEDKPALPYIEAVLRETLRWFPIVPLGVWHATSEDDVYEGHYIPKGAAVISNIWAIARNPAKYPNPDKFIPERFLGPDGQPTDDTAMYAFGFGRRVCAGRHVALNSVWMSIATILTLFNIRKAKDEHGREISPKLPYSTGVVTTPLAYPCHISPRSPDIDMERLNEMISDIYDE